MASYSVTRAKHATLSSTTVDTVTISGTYTHVEIVNTSGSTTIYATVGVGGSTPSDPTAAGDNTFTVPAGTVRTVPLGGTASPTLLENLAPIKVKVIGNGNGYSVTGV